MYEWEIVNEERESGNNNNNDDDDDGNEDWITMLPTRGSFLLLLLYYWHEMIWNFSSEQSASEWARCACCLWSNDNLAISERERERTLKERIDRPGRKEGGDIWRDQVGCAVVAMRTVSHRVYECLPPIPFHAIPSSFGQYYLAAVDDCNSKVVQTWW